VWIHWVTLLLSGLFSELPLVRSQLQTSSCKMVLTELLTMAVLGTRSFYCYLGCGTSLLEVLSLNSLPGKPLLPY
jgi:hypothetical protein